MMSVFRTFNERLTLAADHGVRDPDLQRMIDTTAQPPVGFDPEVGA
jgi:hypothetical protein